MPDPRTVQEEVTEALVAAFRTSREMCDRLEEHGIAWLRQELDVETGTRDLAADAVRYAMTLDPTGLSELRALLLAAVRARRGKAELLAAAARLGLVLPRQLQTRPDDVLRLRIIQVEGEYEVHAGDAATGRAEARRRPFDSSFEDDITRLGDILIQASAPRRDVVADRQHDRGILKALGDRVADRQYDKGLLKALGDKVFDFLFPAGDMRALYKERLDAAWRDGVRLQVMLDARSAPSLAHVPWELAFDPQKRGHLCLRQDTSLARHVEAEPRFAPPDRELRFLGFISLSEASDTDVPTDAVQAERERQLIGNALKRLPSRVEQVWSTAGTRVELGRLLNSRQRGGWSVFHFIGHGGFEEEGYLLFQSATGAVRVSAENLANRLLVPGLAPQLVVLNCCSGATAAKGNRFSSFAETLVASGVRAVIGMQFPVSDPAALLFSESFYGALVEGSSVQHALNAARLVMNDETAEWVTPALFTSGPDFALVEPDPVPDAAAGAAR